MNKCLFLIKTFLITFTAILFLVPNAQAGGLTGSCFLFGCPATGGRAPAPDVSQDDIYDFESPYGYGFLELEGEYSSFRETLEFQGTQGYTEVRINLPASMFESGEALSPFQNPGNAKPIYLRQFNVEVEKNLTEVDEDTNRGSIAQSYTLNYPADLVLKLIRVDGNHLTLRVSFIYLKDSDEPLSIIPNSRDRVSRILRLNPRKEDFQKEYKGTISGQASRVPDAALGAINFNMGDSSLPYGTHQIVVSPEIFGPEGQLNVENFQTGQPLTACVYDKHIQVNLGEEVYDLRGDFTIKLTHVEGTPGDGIYQAELSFDLQTRVPVGVLRVYLTEDDFDTCPLQAMTTVSMDIPVYIPPESDTPSEGEGDDWTPPEIAPSDDYRPIGEEDLGPLVRNDGEDNSLDSEEDGLAVSGGSEGFISCSFNGGTTPRTLEFGWLLFLGLALTPLFKPLRRKLK